jgi:glycoside/pentoside/hexuronide:cation symporter, GPH family
VYAVLAGMLFFTTFITSKERVSPPKVQSSVKSDFSDLLKNRPWIILCLMGLATLIYVSVRNNATVYYFKYYIGHEKAFATFTGIGTAFSMLGALLAPRFTRWMGGDKRRTFIVLTIICGVVMALGALVQPVGVTTLFGLEFANSGMLFGTHIVLSVCNAAMMPLIWSMYADTADYGEWRFQRRATGLVFSAGTFSQKVGWALGGGVFGGLLQYVGFVANQAQSESSLAGIRNMFTVIPAAMTLVAIGITFAYNLTSKNEQQIKEELAARRAQAGDA